MATAHLTYGYLGAGKTTFAKKLEQKHSAVRFSPDEWMLKLFGSNPPADKFNDYYQRIDSIIEGYWTKCLSCNVDVILDFGFWTRMSRDKARAKVHELGGTSKLYYVSCSEEIMRERCLNRNHNLEKEGSLYIDPNTFEMFRKLFEPLGEDEVYEEIKSD